MLNLQIQVGYLAAEADLPSEADLAKQYGVTSDAVHEALKALALMEKVRQFPGGWSVGNRTEFEPPRVRTQIARDLVRRLRTGEWSYGDRMLSETEVMAAYDVTRGTARQAYQRLAAAQLVEIRHGQGAFCKVKPS
ncbi:GntR family transcriptional regulator [Cryptosporangium phraense]|uniref:GntR family transcriptional regulator n=1 Tax=Cryptosporangium phraense TaxID=2593070 RepID=UPI00197A75E6|nr:GntR family transcriptional regulator [Cryptosporangium phraense]